MTSPLYAITPLDGRHASLTAPLSPYASEAGLMRARVRVEIEYLLALAKRDDIPLNLNEDSRTYLRSIYEDFSEEDATIIKKIEIEGYDSYEATNHDVKAVEYFIRHRLHDDLSDVKPWIHFGLTSEDVNNLSHRLLVRDAMEEVIIPELRSLEDELVDFACHEKDTPLLGRTHGQPATPTTFGKEMAVYASRLSRATERVQNEVDNLTGKLSGATGTYAAHVAAFPDTDWQEFAQEFVTGFDLEFVPLTTQINPCDDLASLFNALRGVNNILLDLNVDVWLYIGNRLLGQKSIEGEVGSSTMPHKINPIDFEISEGNLSKANADLTFLSNYMTTSRLQRDLSDAPSKRSMGAALAFCLIGYARTLQGLEKITVDDQRMREELAANPEIIGEAVQTILRREGHQEAYESVKELTRGRQVTLEEFYELFDSLDVDESVVATLQSLTPENYTGLASQLTKSID